jgi:uncharacterized protein (DUF2164 family)
VQDEVLGVGFGVWLVSSRLGVWVYMQGLNDNV